MQPTSESRETVANNLVGNQLPRSSSIGISRPTRWRPRSLSWAPSTSSPGRMAGIINVNVDVLLNRNGSSARRALDGLRFINRTTSNLSETWGQVSTRFDNLAKEGLLAKEHFGKCIGMESNEFARAIYDVLARRMQQRTTSINKDQMKHFWEQLSNPSFEARIHVFFEMVDNNGDGRIDRDEIQELILLSASANKLGCLIGRAEEYANLIMEELDLDGHGYIELLQLEQLLLQGDVCVVRRRPKMIRLPWGQKIAKMELKDIFRRVKWLITNYWQRGWVTLLWLLAMAGLFFWKFIQYRQKAAFHVMGYCLCTAKGAAETLKLNMALILLAMCRNTLTFLRSTWVGLFIPFNDNLNFHKTMGLAIVIGIVLHAGNHLACDFPRLVNSSPEKFKMIASHFNHEKPTYTGLVTGITGITGISMIVLMVISFTLASAHVRRSLAKLPIPFKYLGNRKAFRYSHPLHCLVYVLLLIHGTFLFLAHRWNHKTTWMYISFPVILFIVEKALRMCLSGCYSADMLLVFDLPCNVFSIRFRKPENFKYRSGQYIFIQCPAISKFQWHPFSLTSAPGDDYLRVHIRAVGSWTTELKRILTSQNLEQEKSLNLLVDGPYGAPAQDYTNYDVLLLLGLGIGATPFISVLRDLLNHRRAEGITDTNRMRVRSARFYWVTKEHTSFEWFRGDMNEVAAMAQEGFINVHNYVTSVYEERDARSTLIAMINDLNHRVKEIDTLTGTWVKTHFGRPNWNVVFNNMAKEHEGRTVGVFYCGNMELAKKLKKLANEMSRNTRTIFKFHKEQF